MGKYNKKAQPVVVPTVVNHQGGVGYALEPKLELIALLATGIENKFYEKEGEREKRLATLVDTIAKTDSTFVAKALVYARTKMGQRTVTHIGAVDLAKHLSGSELGKRFYSKRDRKENKGGIIFRLDDLLEITACYQAKNPGKPLSNALKKGFKDAIEAADTYELAKYQAKTRDISLVDIVNLVHPIETKTNGTITVSMEDYVKATEGLRKQKDRTQKFIGRVINGKVTIPALHALSIGLLKQFNTVEDKNTKAGQEVAAKVKSGEITQAQAAVVLQEAKEDNYGELIRSKKIGYLALLRNLRNILKNTSDKVLIKDACDLLTDEKFVKKSLVFPHQIDLALEVMLTEFSASQMGQIAIALNTAYELAIPNLTELFNHGRTAVVFDTSASMTGGGTVSNGNREKAVKYNTTAATKASLIGATLAKGIGADLYHFASSAEEIKFNPADTVNTIKNKGISMTGRVGHGTDFNSIFTALKGKYDRIFIISDMQGGDGIVAGSGYYGNAYQEYCKKNGTPFIYAIDIQGYGTTMFKQDKKLITIYGYNSDIYEYVKKAEVDPKAILAEIDAIQI